MKGLNKIIQKEKIRLFVFLLVLFGTKNVEASQLISQKKANISGYVKDGNSGELLIGASIYVKEIQGGAVSNSYGFYSCELPVGNYEIQFSYLGYQTEIKQIYLKSDVEINVELFENSESLKEVVVRSQRQDANVRDPQMSVQKLQSKIVKVVPALMGEADVLKVLQLMPGVQASSEGSSGFSVRGGNPDQNLTLLDEAIVYSAGHLMGFFSVFNNDAIKDVKMYKGDIPAKNGGRLSSLVDVRMKEGNNKKLAGSGGIGLISSRFTLEGPVVKNRSSFIVSGRRTYADLFLPLLAKEEMQDNQLYFYDINAKINHMINDKNRIYFSTYLGRDVFKDIHAKMEFGNKTFSFRWNHVYSPKLFSTLSIIHSNYDYKLNSSEEAAGFRWLSKLKDYSAKIDFNYYLNANNTIAFGGQSIFHSIEPGTAGGTDENPLYNEIEMPRSNALEHAVYVSNTQNIGSRLNFKYGLRFSVFQNIGKGTVYRFNENYEEVGLNKYNSGKIFNTYRALEPRVGISFLLNEKTSLKTAYSRTLQYMHLASNSTSGTPLDVWFMSSPNIKPQISNQFSFGYFKNFLGNTIESSIETFYKDMKNTIDFKDHPDLLLNDKMEGEVRTGKSWAYGIEFLLKLNRDKYSGWIGYTWSKSWRKIPEINAGQKYLSPYNRKHDISVVMNRKMGKRGQLSMNWVYSTGAPYTAPAGRMFVGGDVIPVYSGRNEERMPNYHRMDVAYTLPTKNKKNRKWQGEWNFAIYNLYGRKNAWSIYFEQDKNEPHKVQAKKTYLFQFIPSVTYNFKF